MRIYTSILLLFILLISVENYAQNIAGFLIVDSLSGKPMPGATVRLLTSGKGAAAYEEGIIHLKIQGYADTLRVSYIGYVTRTIPEKDLSLTGIRETHDVIIQIKLIPSDIEYSQTTITSSRINSYISASPLRVEVLGDEELTEKLLENPTNISELLSELSAVQMTQTSQLSGSTNFRLLGLPGRFTLLMKDGLPLFGGAAQEMSFMQLLPIDLKQVEIIKGASSALYGNGAVGGVINLITKQPKEKPELHAVSSWNSFRGTAAGVFYSQRNNDIGFSVIASTDNKSAADVNHDGYTEIPKADKFVFEPAFYYYKDDATVHSAKLSWLNEKRSGGKYTAISLDNGKGFIQHDNTNSIAGYFSGASKLSAIYSWSAKAGFMHLNNSMDIPAASLNRHQDTYFWEASVNAAFKNHNLVFGASVLSDRAALNGGFNFAGENLQTTTGAFTFDEFSPVKLLSVQIGMRYDQNNAYTGFFSPAFSGMYKLSNFSFVRLSTGTAYKTPGLFSDDDGNFAESSILPSSNMKAELARNIMLDGSYKFSPIEDVFVSLNQVFFYVQIENPVVLTYDRVSNRYFQVNQSSPIRSKGTETNIRVSGEDVKYYFGVSFEKTERLYSINKNYPLSPEFKMVSILSFEDDGIWEFDLGGIYYGRQYLDDGTSMRQYGTYEAAFIRNFGNLKAVLNCENIGNIRQSNYMPLVVPSAAGPKFNEVWAPVEGRMFVLTVLYSL